MAARENPSGISIGTSFIECTAISARLSSSACSSSLMNSPLPPILESDMSSIWSPRVVMPNMPNSVCGYNSDKPLPNEIRLPQGERLSRVAITIFGVWMNWALLSMRKLRDYFQCHFSMAGASRIEAHSSGGMRVCPEEVHYDSPCFPSEITSIKITDVDKEGRPGQG